MNIKKNKLAYIIVFVILIVFSYDFIGGFLRRKEIKENPKYTIGTTYKSEFRVKSGTDIYYYYYVKGKKYTYWEDAKKNIRCPNGRYYVKFSSKKPKYSEILFHLRVPSHIKKAPPEGWDEIPDW